MMKRSIRKRLEAAVLLAAMSLTLLPGCGKQAGRADSAADTEESTSAVESTAAAGSASEGAAETEAASGDSTDYTGGTPWLASSVAGNVTADTTAELQDDFYLATNLGWFKSAKIKEGHIESSNYEDAADFTLERVQDMLSDQQETGHNAELVYAYYNAFMNWDERNALGIEPLRELVSRIEAVSSLSELSALFCDPAAMDVLHCFVSIGNTESLDDATRYITCVDSGSLLLADAAEYEERSSYGQNRYDATKRVAERMMERLGYDTAEADKRFEEAIALETLLAKGMMTSAETMQPDYLERINNVMTPEESYALCQNYPLEAYIRAAGYDEAEHFLVTQPDYLRTLDEVYTEEHLDGLKSTVLIYCLESYLGMLDREAEEIQTEMYNTISGSSGNTSDEENAYTAVSGALYEPLGQLYLEKYDASETKVRITALCEEIISYYKEMLGGIEWLSEETRQKAIEKLDKITIHAAYPDKWNDYSALNLTGLSAYDCWRVTNAYKREIDRSRTNQTVDRELWNMNILEANAFYNSQNNSINIILGLLNGYFYSDDMRDEELYAAIGASIGHEISHAFDTNGAQFDQDGNFADWWAKEDYQAFTERADKLAAYYDTISPWKGEKVRGSNIQSEAIADMAGMKCLLAIAASKKDFDYELFFTTYAGRWRELDTPEFAYYLLTQDVHPFSYLRANVNLQQFEEFYETYDIKEGDGMYLAPEDRVKVW